MKDTKPKKILFLLLGLLALIIIGTQSATAQIEQTTNIAIDVGVNIQRITDNQYELTLKNQVGTEKVIISPSTPTFSNHSVRINYALDEAAHCTRSENVISQYISLSNTMGDMLKLCENAMKQYNASEANLRLISEAQLKQVEFEKLWQVEKNSRENFQKTAETCESELEKIKRERDQLQATANLATTRGAELTVCTENLEKAENGKTNNLIIGAVLGIAGGYFFWGRKNNNSNYSRSRMPPEQEDALEDYY